MPTVDPSDNDRDNHIAALRAAVLAAHEERVGNFPLAAMRAAVRLRRFRLGWLLGPWVLADVLRGMRRATVPTATQQSLVRRYAQASGTDSDLVRAEVKRIQDQLGLIDPRSPRWLDPDFAGRWGARGAELEEAADALLRYFVRGRQTDDRLFAETQAAYAAYEQETQQSALVMRGREPRARQRLKVHRQEQAAALGRYVDTWRRWFDARETADGGR